ncbi:MAG: hypothetical protein JWQ69_5733 [Pseudomonas sp.]|nr:hypothetical protein [Pseudomonas sp.]
MTSTTALYFHAKALKSRFEQDLTEAVAAEHLDELEKRWLQQILNHSTVANDTAAPSISTLTMIQGVPAGIDLASAILIQDQISGSSVVYLNTLLFGLERFNNRTHLYGVLQTRFGTRMGKPPEFEYESVQDPAFESRMFRIIDRDADRLDALVLQLQQIPSLQSILRDALVEQITALMPSASTDPTEHVVQIIETGGQPSHEQVVQVKNLEEVMLDRFLGRVLPANQQRRFLNALGQALDLTQTARYEPVLSGVESSLLTSAEKRLGNFWHTPVGHGQTRREYMADALAESFRRELLERRQDGMLDASEFRRIRGLLGGAGAQWGYEQVAKARKLTLSVNDGEPMKLAGAFLIESIVDGLSELRFYCADKGLIPFRNRGAMNVYFSSKKGRAELLPYLSLEDHGAVLDAARLHLDVEGIDGSLFLDRVDSIIGLQNRNLKYALGLRAQGGDQMAVLIDDALDIRSLIDRHLWRLNSGDRWPAIPGKFHERWFKKKAEPTQVFVPAKIPATEKTRKYRDWLERVQELGLQSQRMGQAHPGVRSCARSVLNGQLSILGSARLDAMEMQVQFAGAAGTEQTSSIDLITLLLERVSGHRALPLAADCTVLTISRDPFHIDAVKQLSPLLINHLLDRARQQFTAAYSKQVRGFFPTAQRQAGGWLRPGPLSCEIFEQLLRIDLAHERKAARFKLTAFDLFEQILDRPQRQLRTGQRTDIVEVYGVFLKDGGQGPAQRISNLFVFDQSSHPEKGAVLWSPINGIREFDSFAVLKRYIKVKLWATRTREQWLKLVVKPDKLSIRQALTNAPDSVSIDLVRLDGHFIEQTRLTEQERQYRQAESVLESLNRRRADADLLVKVQSTVEDDDMNDAVIDTMTDAIRFSFFEAIMPTWVKTASPHDLAVYLDLLHRYYRALDPELQFMADIPILNDFARDKLVARLKIDFPDQALDPDAVQITLTQYVASPVGSGEIPSFLPAATVVHRETLTEYALNHFSAYQDATLTVTTSDGGPVAKLLTTSYLKTLIRTLDVGNSYRQLLDTKLDQKATDYATRQKSFSWQWPALLLEEAFRKKLEKQLSFRAYEYIESVMTMPDGLARQTVHEEDIVISPIRLLPDPERSADPIPGCYLIAPKDPLQGPVILYTVANQDFMFKEYSNRSALLMDIQTSSRLQSLFMRRVNPEVQVRYGHRSFHLPPVWRTEFYSEYPVFPLAPVTLDIQPIEGDALQQQFKDTVQLLKIMAKAQTVTTAEADWASFKHLMTLGAEQLLMFAPGGLGLLIAAWQSASLAGAAAISVSKRRWGQALAEFTAALSLFAASKQAIVEESALEAAELEALSGAKLAGDTRGSDAAIASNTSPESEFSWRNSQLPNELKTRLKVFEASGVALINLTRLESSHVYQNPQSLKRYASVAGSVYQVDQEAGQWRIVDDTRKGPNIKLNEHEQWELDLQWGLKGGGPVVSRLQTRQIDRDIDRMFITEASGMADIRLLYRGRAKSIEQAYAQAQSYLRTCLDNLEPAAEAALDPRTLKILSDFFGQPTPSATLIGKVRDRMRRLWNELTDTSLSPQSSSRFFVGSLKSSTANIQAFVFAGDPLKRIFLPENFFFIRQAYRLRSGAHGLMGFNRANHFRASTLIHELSHQVLATDDIAYLEASAPFLDLLDVNHPFRVGVKARLTRAQETFLSHRTPPKHLFQVRENHTWRDIGKDEGEGKARVLKVTKKKTLAQARTEFFANDDVRSEVILSNADSVALLATLLGRELFV